MDVADQFEQVGLFFAEDGFVAVLKEMAGSLATFVENVRKLWDVPLGSLELSSILFFLLE